MQVQINLELAPTAKPKIAATTQMIIPAITNEIIVRFMWRVYPFK